MRFGLIAFPKDHAALLETASLSEQLGYDTLYSADHLFHFGLPEAPFLDGWITLAGWVPLTTRIRLGVLVANLAWRSPVTVARAVVALDQFSGGRIELGVGVGRFADQAMAGVLEMSGGERVARLEEGLVVLDRLLRGDHEPFSGRFTTYQAAQTAPGCVQQPRPPLIVAAHGPQALAVAARHGDVWSSYGGFGLSLDELMAVTWSRSDALTVACDACGRDPASIGRSLLVYSDSADPWSDRGALVRVVEELRSMRFDEVVFYWPAADRRADFERASLEVLPQLR